MNSPCFSWCIHVTRGPIFNLRTLNFFLREANADFAVKLSDLAPAPCVGQAVGSEAVLLRHGVAGLLFSLIKWFLDSFLNHLVVSGCLAKPRMKTDTAWRNYLAVCGCWFSRMSEIMSRAAVATTRLNDNSLQNCTWYMHSKAAVKFPRVSSLSGISHPQWEQDFPSCYTSEVLPAGSWEEIVWFLFLSGEKETLDLKAERVKTAPYWRKSSNSTQGRQKLWLNKRVWVSLGGGGRWSPKEGECALDGQRDETAVGEGRRWVTGWGSAKKQCGWRKRNWDKKWDTGDGRF